MRVNGQFIKSLKMSARRKIQSDWSRDVSRGFLAEEILEATRNAVTGNIKLVMEGYTIDKHISEYNLPETEEILKWIEYQDGKIDTGARKIPYE